MSTTTYSHTELLALKDEYELIQRKLRSHERTCWHCFDEQSPCEIAEYLDSELESIREVIGYTDPTDTEDSDPDLPYEDLVADYIRTSSEQDTDRWDFIPDHSPQLDDAWLLTSEGLNTLKETQPTFNPLMDYFDNHIRQEAVFGHTEYGDFDPELTATNFRAQLRIWTTRRGELAIYKTFLKNFTFDQDTQYWSFDAYCAPCKKSLKFNNYTTRLLIHFLLTTVKHAHSHLTNSEVEVHIDPELTQDNALILNGSDAYDEEDNLTFIRRAGNWQLNYLRLKHRTTYLTQQELALGKAWSEFLKEL